MKKLLFAALIIFLGIHAHVCHGVIVTSDTVEVTCVIGSGSPVINISAESVDTLQYVDLLTSYRFNLPKLTCDFFAPGSGWEIQVYHTNGVGDTVFALKQEGATAYLPLKMWQPNYGPTNYYAFNEMPDVMDITVWTNNVKWIGDINNSEGIATLGSDAAQDAPPIVFNLAVDASDSIETNYTAELFFELIVP